jgi:hypothetical protein
MMLRKWIKFACGMFIALLCVQQAEAAITVSSVPLAGVGALWPECIARFVC